MLLGRTVDNKYISAEFLDFLWLFEISNNLYKFVVIIVTPSNLMIMLE